MFGKQKGCHLHNLRPNVFKFVTRSHHSNSNMKKRRMVVFAKIFHGQMWRNNNTGVTSTNVDHADRMADIREKPQSGTNPSIWVDRTLVVYFQTLLLM